MHKKVAQDHPNLNDYFKKESTYYRDVYKVKASEDYSKNVTGCILSSVIEVVFIVVLQYTSVGHTHATRINIGLDIIYDCVGNCELQLNYESFSK